MKKTLPLALSIVLALPVPAATAADWNTGVGGNSARNSQSRNVGPATETLIWGGSRSALVAQQGGSEGDLFVSSRITSFTIPTGAWIVAQDLNTGDERWAVQLPYDFPGTSWRSRFSAIRDGKVYATRAGNTNLDPLYALDAADGSIIWRSEDLVDEGSTESVAFAQNGDVIAGNFASLLRISHVDGTTVWSAPRSCPTSNGCQAAVYGDRVYIWEQSPQGPVVTVFDIADGTELYSTPSVSGGLIEQKGPFVGPDGTVYAPRSANNPATDFLVAYDDSGAAFVEKWRVPLGYVPFASFGVGPDGSVYSYRAVRVGDEKDLSVQRLDPDTGAVLDESAPTRVSLGASPRIAIDAEGKVFFTNGGFPNGALFALDADLAERWSQAIVNVNVGGPVLGEGGVLVVCGVGNNVRAYRTKSDTCDGDIDLSGAVDFQDIVRILAAWGPCPGCQEDLDGDGFVTFQDLLIVLGAWGGCDDRLAAR